METLLYQKTSRKQKIAWVPQENWVTEQSWSATKRKSDAKCTCTIKDTRGRAVPNAHARSRVLAFLVEIDRIANDQINFTRAFVGKGLLQRLIQSRTTLSRRRQRYHGGKRKIWPNKLQKSMMNSGHRGLLGHGHLHQGLRGGFLRHRRHRVNPNDQPHLMSQQLVLNTYEWTPAQGDLWRNGSDSFFFFQFFLNLWLDNRRVTIRTGDVRGYNLSRTLFSALLHSDAHVTYSAHWSDFNGIRSV